MTDSPFPPKGEQVNSLSFTDEELINACHESNINKFTVFLTPTSPLKAGNPYTLRNDILANISDTKNVTYPIKTRSGAIVLTANNIDTAKEVLAIKEIQSIPVVAKLNYDNLLTDYVIQNIETDIQLDAIQQDLQDQNIFVFQICRFMKFQNGQSVPLHTIKFRTPTQPCSIPEKVYIGVQFHEIKIFEERPRQCQKCWLFGHGSRTCRSNFVCKKCSGKHEVSQCTEEQELICRNCKGNHYADDKNCPARTHETITLKIKRENKISYTEAKRLNRSSYAAKVRQSINTHPLPENNMVTISMTDLQSTITNMVTKSVQELVRQTVVEQMATLMQPLLASIVELKNQVSRITGDTKVITEVEDTSSSTNDLTQAQITKKDHPDQITSAQQNKKLKRSMISEINDTTKRKSTSPSLAVSSYSNMEEDLSSMDST